MSAPFKAVAIRILALMAAVPTAILIGSFHAPNEIGAFLIGVSPCLILMAWAIALARAKTGFNVLQLAFSAGAMSFALLTGLTLSQYLGLDNHSWFKLADPTFSDVLVFLLSGLLMVRGAVSRKTSRTGAEAKVPLSLKSILIVLAIGWIPASWGQSSDDVKLGLRFRYNCIEATDDAQLGALVKSSFNFGVPDWFLKKFPVEQTSCTLVSHHISGPDHCFAIVQAVIFNRATNVSVSPFTWSEMHNAAPNPSCVQAGMGANVALRVLSDAAKK